MRQEAFIKAAAVLALGCLITGAASATYLINSEDWKDVYSGSYHAYSQNETPYFVRNNNLGVFNVLPYGEEVNIIESSDTPMISNIERQVESQDYSVGEVLTVEDGNQELRPEQAENVIVVPEDYPSASLVSAPYARVTDSWVLIVSNDNLGQVEQVVEDSTEATMIGDFNREITDTLSSKVDQKIISPNKFNLSVKVAEAYLEEEDSSKVMIGSGDHISRDIMEGSNPLLLSGTNYLPEELGEFLLKDPEHGINTTIMIGNEMTTVGEEIRDRNIIRNNETTDEKMTVFVKYGQARGDSNSIYAISLFPLPTGDVSLSIPSASYNPETGNVLITYRNDGESRMYQLTSFEIISDREVISQGGDEEAVFIGGNTNRTVSYEADINSSSIGDAYVEFSTTYGTSPSQLDTYLTEQGQFSPPLSRDLKVEEVEDDSNMSVSSVEYVEGLRRFKVAVKNHGDEEGYAQVRLTGVEVRGQEESFASERKEIDPGKTKTFYVVAELDEIDLEQNDEVKTVLSYGEAESQLVNSRTSSKELEVVERTITPVMVGGAAVLLLILVGGIVGYRKLDINIEVSE